MKFAYIPPVLIFVIACALFIEQRRTWQQQPATKRFIQKNIPLDEILLEWDQKGLKGPRYICSCTQTRCDSEHSWPFRSFKQAESIPVLGASNKALQNETGFTECSPARERE